jgi:quercetin dioxygenase-like cupin family protein
MKRVARKTGGRKAPIRRKVSSGKAVRSAETAAVFRQRGVIARKRGKPELKHVPWARVELEQLNPSIQRQFIVGHDLMVARILIKKGGLVPEHSHVNEQVTYILEGALKFTIGGRDIVVRAGEVLAIPPNLPHSAEALEDTVDLDVFNPPRADWINKDDSYLRQARTTGLAQKTRK